MTLTLRLAAPPDSLFAPGVLDRVVGQRCRVNVNAEVRVGTGLYGAVDATDAVVAGVEVVDDGTAALLTLEFDA